ncbi:MAG TPA: phosphoribosyltransferase family protein [Candidatus Saccharibacteria bacterium]|nr:phosphoribosyltransferase family protein [Candidatus Saccharibacteria bacterium]
MYFESRQSAGQILAKDLYDKYRYEDCVVVALSDGAVVIGEQIARSLHCVLTMLLMENIDIPGEGLVFGSVSQNGNFTYNGLFSAGEIEEYTSEFHGYLEDQKRVAFQKINRLLGDGGIIKNDMLRDRVIILVTEGLDTAMSVNVAIEFLKPIRIKKLVIASPVASVQAVDKVHVLADELHILSTRENYMGTNHYYEHYDVPSHEKTIEKINQIILNWH